MGAKPALSPLRCLRHPNKVHGQAFWSSICLILFSAPIFYLDSIRCFELFVFRVTHGCSRREASYLRRINISTSVQKAPSSTRTRRHRVSSPVPSSASLYKVCCGFLTTPLACSHPSKDELPAQPPLSLFIQTRGNSGWVQGQFGGQRRASISPTFFLVVPF
jgi:hypothetical protein